MGSKKLRAGLLLFLAGGVAAVAIAVGINAWRGPSGPETGWELRRHREAEDRSSYTNTRPNEERYKFPLNIDVEHVAGDDAPLEGGELVLGVVIGGEARAYPVNYMMGPANEIVNDTLGGVPIAPTW